MIKKLSQLKKNVKTHLPNQLAQKMDDAEARDFYPAIEESVMPKWVGGCCKTRGASSDLVNIGADLGGSNKYLNENFKGKKGGMFHVNDTCTWSSRS